ncbi:hypothetical protein [Sphingomonas nostoxanthinifaciens]|uniref:hypothetical protein n=1 Tax=Sphingomonas nostoxanthinifaciens TaxID=2872652 RepID=UPI001CC216D6|nr:hypothetical protein [Sphingomonas nostoxanthinifaciens]UAK23647.1 hypothetical protein K8P63_14830 [Sphingomonas nostoxanthinifaciens]
MAARLTREDIRAHYGISREVEVRWRKGIKPARRRAPRNAIPADLAVMAAKLNFTAFARHYGRREQVVRSWSNETGIITAKLPLRGTALGLPAPDDFASVAAGMTRAQLANQFDVSVNTVDRWLAVSGVRPNPGRTPFYRGPKAAPSTIDMSLAARAARYLQNLGPVVYKSEILPPKERQSVPDDGRGRYYVGGKGHIPIADMIALAEAKGWRRAA